LFLNEYTERILLFIPIKELKGDFVIRHKLQGNVITWYIDNWTKTRNGKYRNVFGEVE